MADAIDIFINAIDKTTGATNAAKAGLLGVGDAAKKTDSDLGTLHQTGNKLWGVLGGVGAAAGLSAAGAVAALGFALKDSYSAARESIDASNQLDSVLRSTGGAAGVTAEQAKNLASSLMGVTNFGDDAVLSGENMLLTFTNIGSDVFPRATETMLDMSQALGQDLKSSSIQLGKALNDPIAGVSALSRVGVTFTDQQKEMIKTMVDAGDVAGAQGLILNELGKEFGGSAKAMADPAIQLQNAWGELEEQVGMFVIPVLDKLSKVAMPLLTKAMDLLAENTDYINQLLTDFLDYSLKLVKQLWDWGSRVMPPLIESMGKFFDNITLVWDVIVKISKPVTDAIGKFVKFEDVMTAVGILMAGPLLLAVYGVIASLVSFLAPIAAVVAAVAALRYAWENDFLGIKTFTINTINRISDWFFTTSGIWQGTWEKTFSKLENMIQIFWERKVYFAIRSWLIQTSNDIQHGLLVIEYLWDHWTQATTETITNWVNDVVRILTNWKDIVITTFHDFADPIADYLYKWSIGVYNTFKHWIDFFIGDLGLFNKWRDKAIEIFQEVFDWWDKNVQPWIDRGKAIIQGFWDGTKEVWNRFTSWAGTTFQGWVDWFDRLFQFGSPSRLMYQRGQWLMEGLGDGIKAYSHIPLDEVDSLTNSLTAQMQRLQGAVIPNTFNLGNAASQLHIDPRLLPPSLGGTGTVTGIAPGGGLWMQGITNLPWSSKLPAAGSAPAAASAGSTTNNYTITLQGSNNANADVLGLVQLLGSLQGASTP